MDEYDIEGKRSLGIIDVRTFRQGIECIVVLKTLSHFFLNSKYSDPNSSRDGTEKDVRTLKKTFIENHQFDLDLELTEKVKVAEVKQGMKDFVEKAVSTNAKCIVLVVMSHGKENDWYF